MNVSVSVDKDTKKATVTVICDVTEPMSVLEKALEGKVDEAQAKDEFTRNIINCAFNAMALAAAAKTDAQRAAEVARLEAALAAEKASTPSLEADVDAVVADKKAVVAAKEK